jgi:hypothetical protein
MSWTRSIAAPVSAQPEIIEITGDPSIEGNVLRGQAGTFARSWPPYCVLTPE